MGQGFLPKTSKYKTLKFASASILEVSVTLPVHFTKPCNCVMFNTSYIRVCLSQVLGLL